MLAVAHNLSAMNAQRQFGINVADKSDFIEKLSIGSKNNEVAQEWTGLAISENVRRQIQGLTHGMEKTQESISLCQVADGALLRVNDMLHRVTELSIKAADDTNTQEERKYIQREINQLLLEIDKIENTTSFDEKKIFGGEVGVEASVEIDAMNTEILGISGLDVTTVDGASHAIDAVKGALHSVAENRGKIGAQQKRLEYAIANEGNIVKDTVAAESVIRDVDRARDMVRFSNNNILKQVGFSMMAQANQSNQGVLSLLQ